MVHGRDVALLDPTPRDPVPRRSLGGQGLPVCIRQAAYEYINWYYTGWQGAFSPFLSEGLGGVFAAMGLTFIAFEGYEIIAQTSEEVEDPKRNVPRAVFLSLLIVVPIYLLVAFVAVGAVIPPDGMPVTAYLAARNDNQPTPNF